MKKLLFLILIVSLFILNNCNRCKTIECSEGNTKNRISTVVKKYFYFKTGSWWVYQNEISLVRDSIYVVQEKIESVMEDESCDCKELLLVRTGSSLDHSLFYNTECYNSPSISFLRTNVGSSFYYITYRFIVKNDSTLRLENSHNGIISFFKTFKGLKEEYKNVYRCFYHKTLTDYLSDSYFALNVGLIRFAYKDGDGTYWNLINYHVIQ